MGLVKRRMYRPDRLPARAKAWNPGPNATFTEAKLTLYEAELGIAAVADDHDVRVGRILGYDKATNLFTIVGNRIKERRMHLRNGKRIILNPKPVEMVIAGWRVSTAVVAARYIAGVPNLTRDGLTLAMAGAGAL